MSSDSWALSTVMIAWFTVDGPAAIGMDSCRRVVEWLSGWRPVVSGSTLRADG